MGMETQLESNHVENILDEKLLLSTLLALKKGDFSVRLPSNWAGIAGNIADIFNQIIDANQRLSRENQNLKNNGLDDPSYSIAHLYKSPPASFNKSQYWLNEALANFFSALLDENKDWSSFPSFIISKFASIVEAQYGAIYCVTNLQNETSLRLTATYAYSAKNDFRAEFKLGEGLIGQCAVEKKGLLLEVPPQDYVEITSGIINIEPHQLYIFPIFNEGKIKAVIELAKLNIFTQTQIEFLDRAAKTLGCLFELFNNDNNNNKLILRQSETARENLAVQNEVLLQINKQLNLQNAEAEKKGGQVEQARVELEDKTKQLSLVSKYKSEFLANVSHELRTPLNSLLLLSKQLADNYESNLTPRQVEYANIINKSGNDLLRLINDILDLAKIESGTVQLEIVEETFESLCQRLCNVFSPIAESRNLTFDIQLDANLPATIRIDFKRLTQVLNNLLSNAFKFTEQGGVTLHIALANKGWSLENFVLNSSDCVIAFTVIDTGIGISEHQQKIIFEPFKQGDSGTARKYGGTGLGLSISREIAQLFQGELQLKASAINKGSEFILFIPQNDFLLWTNPESSKYLQINTFNNSSSKVVADVHSDDRGIIHNDHNVVLIVEADKVFANLLLQMLHTAGFKGLITSRGDEAISFARRYKVVAILMDTVLKGSIDGWHVLSILKKDLNTRHIPIHIITVEDEHGRAFGEGATSFDIKPVSQGTLDNILFQLSSHIKHEKKNILLVENDEHRQQEIIHSFNGDDTQIVVAKDGEEAYQEASRRNFDLVVINMMMYGDTAFEIEGKLRNIETLRNKPFIILSQRPHSESEAKWFKRRSNAVIVRYAESIDDLIDVATSMLHRDYRMLPAKAQKVLQQRYTGGELHGRKILIVDDDIRNLYALAGLLESNGLEVLSEESGDDAIALLKQFPVDAVLMDIMMPEMDGYETIRHIREMTPYKSLPIIALTAKAMKDDQEKCIEAGASDYLAKPVNDEYLLTLLERWLRPSL